MSETYNVTPSNSPVTNVALNADDVMNIYNGGTATATTIHDGGYLNVFSGGMADQTNVSAWMDILDGGVANNTTILGNGWVTVSSGGVANTVLVSSGGLIDISSDGMVKDATVNANGELYISGKVTGQITFADGAVVSSYEGGIIDFDISELSPGNAALLNKLSILKGARDYTLTVDGSQATGKYTLAGGVPSFNKSITVVDTLGTELGTFSVAGGETKIGGVNYTLALDGSNLTVTVKGIEADLTGDLDTQYELTTGMVASGVNVNNDGKLDVNEDAFAGKITVNSGGKLDVDSGGAAEIVTVNPGGKLNIYSGGTAHLVRENGGYVLDLEDADVTFAPNAFTGLALGQWDSATVHSGTTATDTTVASGGWLDVFAGGSAAGIVAAEGAFLRLAVAPGVYAQGTYGGSAFEIAGGAVTGYTVNSDTELHVSDGGVASNTVIKDDGWLRVSSGGVAKDATFEDGGGLSIREGGSATGIVAEDGAYLTMIVATDTYAQGAYAGSAFEIGSSVTGVTLRPRFELEIGSGGTAVEIGIGSGLHLDVFSGGTAVDVTVEHGGHFTTYSGGTARNVVENGGYVQVPDGADVTFASHTITGLVFSTVATIHSGTTATHTTVTGGHVFVYGGGIVSDTTINAGTVMLEGGVATGTTINSGGSFYVFSGGVADNTTVNNGGVFQLYNYDDIANNTTVNDGGYFYVAGYNTANGVVVSSGGSLYLTGKLTGNAVFETGAIVDVSGATVDFDLTQTTPGTDPLVNDLSFVMSSSTTYTLTVNGTVVNGTYSLAGGATGFDKTITVNNTLGEGIGTLSVGDVEKEIVGMQFSLALNGSDLTVTVAGGSTDKIITGDITGETKEVPAGWKALNVNINAGGILDVLDGGKANNTNVNQNGMLYVFSGGAASNTNVNSGGTLQVYAGGTADGATVNPGGKAFVSSGTQKITENGGYVWLDPEATDVTFVPNTIEGITLVGGMCGSASVHSGTTAVNVTVNAGGELHVYDGGICSGGVLNVGGALDVYAGGTANGVTVNLGGGLYVSGGTADGVTVNSAGGLYVSGGAATNATVNSGSLCIYSGGEASNPTVNGGNLHVFSGGAATGVVWTPCAGHINIDEGGTATFATSYSGVYYGSDGKLLENAVTMDGKSVGDKCEMYVMEGGKATNAAVDDGGDVFVWSGGVASNTTLVNLGALYVSSGGVANDAAVNANGELFVLFGGVASNVTVGAGGYALVDGRIAGQMTFEAGAEVCVSSGGVIDFDVTGVAPSNAVLVNDLSVVTGKPSYTLTVDGTEATGTYNLAGNVTTFGNYITVVDTSGEDYGYLTIGGTVSNKYAYYTLAITDSTLTVDIVSKAASDTTPPTVTNIMASTTAPTNQNVTVTADFNDNVALKSKLYRIDDGAWTDYVDGVVVTENATVYFKAVDTSGNECKPKFITIDNIDKVKPTITDITPNTTAPATSVTVTAVFDDDVELSTTLYRIGDGGWFNYHLEGVTVTENTTVSFKATDTAGNATTASYDVTNITGGGSVDLTGDLSDSYELTAGKVASDVSILDGGTLEVMNGGVASQTTVNSNGDLAVSEGGVADVVTVNFGGDLYVRNGGVATLVKENGGYASVNDGATATFVSNSFGGYVYNNADDWCTIHDGTTGSNLTAANKGRIYVYSGGIASDTTVNDKGIVEGNSGGLIDGVVVNSGGSLLIYNGAKLTGQMTFVAGAEVIPFVGSILDFDLTQTAPDAAALVNDLSILMGTPGYTLTVDGTQASGTYNLAGNATGFSKAISVRNTSGVDYGYLTFGGTLSTAFANFTLNLTSDDTLTVNVAAKGGSDTTSPTITITPSTTEPTTSVTVSAVFSDDVAVATKQYRVGDGEWKDYTDPVPVTENVTVGFRATDTSGNSTTESYLVTNIENEPENNKLYNKKTGWADSENIATFSVNEVVAGDSMVYLDKKGSVESEDGKYFNSVGRTGTVEDTADYAKIELAYGAALKFSVDSTIGGTFYVYEATQNKKGDLVATQRQKISVKAGKTSPAKLSTIYLEAGEYFVGMEAKLPAAKKNPEVSAYYNVQLTGTKYYEDADDGWNDHAYALDANGKEDKTKLNALLVSGASDFGRGATAIEPDTGKEWVGFSDATDYKMIRLENAVNLTLKFTASGKAKLAIWKVSTGKGGKITLTSKGSVTVKADKTGTIKAKFLDAGEYFVSVTSTDAKKGGDAYYSIAVDPATVFFDSNDDGKNNILYDKKAKSFYVEDANHHFESTTIGTETKVKLDTDPVADTDWENFVGYQDAADYAKIKLTSDGKLNFHLEATGDATFTVYKKGQDKKGNDTLETIQTAKLAVASGASKTEKDIQISDLEAGEYYVSMAAKSTKANSTGSVFYNVTATLDAVVTSALEMPMAAAAYADSVQDKLFGESGNGLLASL